MGRHQVPERDLSDWTAGVSSPSHFFAVYLLFVKFLTRKMVMVMVVVVV